jgi:hypothetical protein
MTTRQYDRNSMLAFPKTAEYADPIERPEAREAICGFILACAIGIGLALALVAWWTS